MLYIIKRVTLMCIYRINILKTWTTDNHRFIFNTLISQMFS